jgi:hypothetical protein
MTIDRSNLIDIDVEIVRETEKAVLVQSFLRDEVWLPKSLIEIERRRDGLATITLSERLAIEKGLV